MRLLVAFVFLLLLSSHLFAQGNSSSDGRSAILIDGKKPAVYLEFVKTGVCHNGHYFTVIRDAEERKEKAELVTSA